ncbi:hypothetical protein [Weissella hellenica]|uniref:Uncharacterized protein n=1 Tax=Weissella hellenica TaxID=46256 RepID=A0A4Y4G284_WEIHE|nr:hypothetical protein [Weissella hellenica]NKY66157.1 hypothetical protein [Weissella hellenica]GED35616.1 hypothetical protein WHE01_05200 [Weissella hellenica]SCB78911.1 hypothetical protein GA0061075_102137 [Weissella hellenica]
MSKGLWVGVIGVIAVIGIGIGGFYGYHQTQDKALKTEQAKTKSMSEKLAGIDKKTSTDKTDKESSNGSSSSSISSVSSNQSSVTETESVALTDAQKQAVNEAFLNWADQRAAMGNMAVNDYYFGHGAAGRGDWYANTPDGQMQVQDENNPGPTAFPIHIVGGVVFLTMKDGSTGRQNDVVESTAGGYSDKADMSKPITKYILGDNGKVYELKTSDGQVSLTTGFGEYNDDGTASDYQPGQDFVLSGDGAAQTELQNLLSAYR